MINSDILILSKNLRYLKEKHNLNEKQLAEISGTSLATIDKLLNNQLSQEFGINALYKLAKYFKISIKDLFTTNAV